jgi:hypothetical protein
MAVGQPMLVNSSTTLIRESYPVYAANKIRDAYAFLAQHFETGDEIFLFGYAASSGVSWRSDNLILSDSQGTPLTTTTGGVNLKRDAW